MITPGLAVLIVTVTNNVMPVKVRPGITVKAPSPLGGMFEDTLEKEMVDLPMGETTFYYESQLTESIDFLEVSPFVIVHIPGERVSGDWFYDGRAQCHTYGPCSLGESPPRVSFPYLYGKKIARNINYLCKNFSCNTFVFMIFFC